jgi:hypothetical protein
MDEEGQKGTLTPKKIALTTCKALGPYSETGRISATAQIQIRNVIITNTLTSLKHFR